MQKVYIMYKEFNFVQGGDVKTKVTYIKITYCPFINIQFWIERLEKILHFHQ